MTLEEARKACDEQLLCLYHLPRNGPYVPAEDVRVYITAVYDDYLHEVFGLPPWKGPPSPNKYGIAFVLASRPNERPARMQGLHGLASFSLAPVEGGRS